MDRQPIPFRLGDLVLFDELLHARIVETWVSHRVQLFRLQLENGRLTDGVVAGYLSQLPDNSPDACFPPLRLSEPSGWAWRESNT